MPFKKWMANDAISQYFSTEKILLIVNEIDQNEISIQGSNIYPITYSTLANVSIFISIKFYGINC